MSLKNNTIRIQPGPANYYSYPGALKELGKFYSREELSRALWLAGERAGEAALPYLPEAFSHARERRQRFTGHCTHETVDALAVRFEGSISLIVGIGGGSVLDTAKALAAKLDLPFIAVPTIAATCAAVTPLSVWYNPEGKALGYEIFRKAADLVLVEPEIILKAPGEYMRAGLADTLAKWYEAEILCSGGGTLPLAARLGLEVSLTLRNVLLNRGGEAFEAMKSGVLNPEFLEVVDAVLIGGGSVGGLGERFTRIAAAHAIHNGLSVLPESAGQLHGIKVAYGILVQEALMGNDDELQALMASFEALELPLNLGGLGIDYSNKDAVKAFVKASVTPGESIHLLPFPVDEDRLRGAVDRVELLAASRGEKKYA